MREAAEALEVLQHVAAVEQLLVGGQVRCRRFAGFKRVSDRLGSKVARGDGEVMPRTE